VNHLVIEFNVSAPPVAAFAATDTGVSRCVFRVHVAIPAVLRTGAFTEIYAGIVQAITVAMVNEHFRRGVEDDSMHRNIPTFPVRITRGAHRVMGANRS